MGRPIECTEALIADICAHLSQGRSQRVTCKIVGISQQTWANWKHRGEDGEAPFDLFLERTTRASAEGHSRLLEHIEAAAPKDWRAAGWLLEHMDPETYARRTEVTGKDGGPIEAQVVIAPALLDALADE